jgi:hypothetical protein
MLVHSKRMVALCLIVGITKCSDKCLGKFNIKFIEEKRGGNDAKTLNFLSKR